MFAATATEFTAEGTANILVNRFIPLWECRSTLLSANGLRFCAQLATPVYKFLGVHKLTTSAYHGNGGVERVSHTMAQMLAMVCNEHQNDWDVHLPHVEYAYNDSVSAATGLAPNEVHIGRLPRFPLAVFDRSHGVAHQSLDRNHLDYCDLARERQLRARSRTARPHSCSHQRAQLHPLERAPGPTQIRSWRLDMGIQRSRHNPTRTIRKGADNKVLKRETFSQLDRPLQNHRRWSLPGTQPTRRTLSRGSVTISLLLLLLFLTLAYWLPTRKTYLTRWPIPLVVC